MVVVINWSLFSSFFLFSIFYDFLLDSSDVGNEKEGSREDLSGV